MSESDFHLLRRSIVQAVRRYFDHVRSSFPTENFYVFSLCTVDDANGLWASTNSERSYKLAAEEQLADVSYLRWLESEQISCTDSILGDLRWNPFEWEYQVEDDHFREVNAIINESGLGRYDEEDQLEFIGFKGCVFAAMVLALEDLDHAGYFGSGESRRSMFLFCSVADSRCAIWLEEDSARRLNAPGLFATFHEQRIKWIIDSMEDEDVGKDDVFAAYLSLLESHL